MIQFDNVGTEGEAPESAEEFAGAAALLLLAALMLLDSFGVFS